MSNKKPFGYWNDYNNCFYAAKECNTRNEFYKKFAAASTWARKNGWFDDYTWFLPEHEARVNGNIGKHKKWTYEACYNEAMKYKARGEFCNYSNGAYVSALKNGWLDDYSWFTPSKSQKKWNYDTCYAEAKKYTMKAEVERKSSGAYDKARDNGWLKDYVWFIPKNIAMSMGRTKWTKDKCYEEAKKYKTRTEFMTKSAGAYASAKRNGWLDDYIWISARVTKPAGYWDKEHCYEEAKKYKSIKEFQRKGKSAYDASKKNGWFDEYDWFKRTTHEDADYWIYSYEDTENKVAYVGLTWRRHRHGEHKSKKNNDVVYRYFKGNVPEQRILMEGLNGEEAQYHEDWYKKAYMRIGWTVLNKAATGVGTSSLGGSIVKWNYDACYKEAMKYKTKSELKRRCRGAFEASKQKGWLNVFFPKTDNI